MSTTIHTREVQERWDDVREEECDIDGRRKPRYAILLDAVQYGIGLGTKRPQRSFQRAPPL